MAHHVLIDFENIQCTRVTSDPQAQVHVFLGPHQRRIPADLAESMQALGERARYVRVTASAPNALDFHIAYYAGLIAARDGQVSIEVVSRDKGFDPLIEHLRSQGIAAFRSTGVQEEVTNEPKESVPDLVRHVVRNLNQRGPHRPASIGTLRNTLRNHLGDDGELAGQVLNTLQQRNWIRCQGERISYALPEVI